MVVGQACTLESCRQGEVQLQLSSQTRPEQAASAGGRQRRTWSVLRGNACVATKMHLICTRFSRLLASKVALRVVGDVRLHDVVGSQD